MHAYFCVICTGARKLEWFVSRDPGYAIQSMKSNGKRADLLVLGHAENSASAYQTADDFMRLRSLDRWKFVRATNPYLKVLEPPKVAVVAGGTGAEEPYSPTLVVQLLREASRLGDIETVRRLYAMLKQTGTYFGEPDPDGGVRARLPQGPGPRPASNAQAWPAPYQTHETGQGISFSQSGSA